MWSWVRAPRWVFDNIWLVGSVHETMDLELDWRLRVLDLGGGTPDSAKTTQEHRVGGTLPSNLVEEWPSSSGVAQWLACWAHNPKVRGSKPRSAMPICRWCPRCSIPLVSGESVDSFPCFGIQGPHRLVVRTSRCGRDNPGSTPGGDIFGSLCKVA